MRNQEFHKGVDGLKSLGTPGLDEGKTKNKRTFTSNESLKHNLPGASRSFLSALDISFFKNVSMQGIALK